MADIKIADIKINDIKPAGADLFGDSEGFLNELTVEELGNVVGGQIIGGCLTISCYRYSFNSR